MIGQPGVKFTELGQADLQSIALIAAGFQSAGGMRIASAPIVIEMK